ncbi:hypothetical protein BH24ACT5_BH24ACT5_31700 [soil metagenome]
MYKNTLAKLAVREAGPDVIDELLVGPTSITFACTDTVGAAKALNDATKTNPQRVVKGAPKAVLEKVAKEAAEAAKTKLEDAGASVELK